MNVLITVTLFLWALMLTLTAVKNFKPLFDYYLSGMKIEFFFIIGQIILLAAGALFFLLSGLGFTADFLAMRWPSLCVFMSVSVLALVGYLMQRKVFPGTAIFRHSMVIWGLIKIVRRERKYKRERNEEGEIPSVLVCEDEKDLLDSYCGILTASGMRVVGVVNGVNALERFCSEKFDLVVTDIFMEAMTGIEFLSAIRMFSCDVPVIIVSGHTQSVTLQEIAKFEHVYVREKPLEPSELLEAVQNTLKRYHKNLADVRLLR